MKVGTRSSRHDSKSRRAAPCIDCEQPRPVRARIGAFSAPFLQPAAIGIRIVAHVVNDDNLTLTVLADGAGKCLANAERLFRCAKTLARSGSYGTAAFLHQTSLEECAKIDMIGEQTTRLLAGGKFDADAFGKSIRSHRSKNDANAYDLKATDAELQARIVKDWNAARAEFAKTQFEFHDESMRLRNAALYVDFRDGRFVAPPEMISRDTAAAIQTFNLAYIDNCRSKVNLLNRWRRDHSHGREEVSKFLSGLNGPAADQGDALTQVKAAIESIRSPVAHGVAAHSRESNSRSRPIWVTLMNCWLSK